MKITFSRRFDYEPQDGSRRVIRYRAGEIRDVDKDTAEAARAAGAVAEDASVKPETRRGRRSTP